MVETALKELTSIVADDYKAFFALAEAYQAAGNLPKGRLRVSREGDHPRVARRSCSLHPSRESRR